MSDDLDNLDREIDDRFANERNAMSDEHQENKDNVNTPERTSEIAASLLRQVGLLEARSDQLGEIRATIHLNFIDKETAGVQLAEDSDYSDAGAVGAVLKQLVATIATLTAEREQVRELVEAVEAINPLHLTHSVQAGHELKTETGSFDGGRSPFKHLDEARSLATQLKEQLCRTQSN